MKRYELEALSKDQIREHAETTGVVVGPMDTKGTMIDRILGEITTPVEVKPGIRKQPDAKDIPIGNLYTLDGQRINGKKWKINIFATEQDRSDVHLIVNGHNIQIKRGVDVIVDEAYVEVLRNAVIQSVNQDPETGIRVPMQMQVYPHTAVPL